MTAAKKRPAIILAGLLLGLLAVTLQGVQGDELEKVPSEDQCRPYIEKALKDLGTEGSEEQASPGDGGDGDTNDAHDDATEEGDDGDGDAVNSDDTSGSREKRDVSAEEASENEVDQVETVEVTSAEDEQEAASIQEADDADSKEDDGKSQEEGGDSKEGDETEEASADDSAEGQTDEEEIVVIEESNEQKDDDKSDEKTDELDDDKSGEEQAKSAEEDGGDSKEGTDEAQAESAEDDKKDDESKEDEAADKSAESKQEDEADSKEDDADKKSVEEETIVAEKVDSVEQEPESAETKEDAAKSQEDSKEEAGDSKADEDGKSEETTESGDGESKEEEAEGDKEEGGESEEGEESRPEEEELTMEIDIPEVLRPREHIGQLLKLDEENEEKEKAVGKVAEVILRDLKRLYDNAIKPLETLYKYRDLSNRHFGDPEIFSKPLVLFMGPWSGGKSSIINYLLDIEYKPTSLRTGAEPSPAYFNILMHGEEEEVLDGTQLAADWTFSGLQKFGQGLLDRLKGYKLKNKLLEKVNIVEIPGILEIRKQVQRLFPFNDACQWFIDRADIIFLVYDPSKLDVGPETEAILDQLKGREYQTRIILNKADQVKPEELMRVQGALIWNISPLMSSAEPPIMYSASLWSIPYEAGAPTRLLYAQERAFLRDLRSAIDKRVEHKIASARRFAVRVRNHAKMVDCYLTTYYNHKSFFAKKKDVADRIIENPQDYHIYEGLSTLTNISRYDLPDPDVYRDFFRLNNLYEFPLLSSTCTYFRGCPINRLDVAIAYDLPELVGKYKKAAEAAQHVEEVAATPTPPPAAPQAQTPKAKSAASTMSLS